MKEIKFYNDKAKKEAINKLKELGLSEEEAKKIIGFWEEEAYILFIKKLEKIGKYLDEGDNQ